MKISSGASVAAAPNVTPMIDVMLVLLIIFMVVAPALMTGVVAEPPQAANLRDHPEQPTDHTLAIDARGLYFLDRRPVAQEALAASIARLYGPTDTNRVLYLRAHKQLPYARVIDAMDIARKNGVVVIGMISEHREVH